MYKKLTEQRLYERLTLPIKVNYEVSTRPRDIKSAISKDISGGGICLSLPEKLLPDTKINIDIKVMQPKSTDYNLKARVAWSRHVEISAGGAKSVYYDTGIEFLEQDPIAVANIATYFYNRKL
jgi:c-di-GMP-binding flagellar brake protein YcgR